jgi:sugar diacid utilization regulator
LTLSLAQLLEEPLPTHLAPGTAVLVTSDMPFRIRGRTEAALERLLKEMSRKECSALIVRSTPRVHQAYPQVFCELSSELAIPLMVTTAPAARWDGVHARIQHDRLVCAERQAAQLDLLVSQLPAQLADARAMQRVVDWLARALDAQVLVSEPDRVLAASPSTAAEQLAHAIIRQSVEPGLSDSSSSPHTQIVSLGPSSGTDCVLAIARRTPLDELDRRLLRHATKLLGLIDQAGRDYRAATAASQAARTATLELLLEGEYTKARSVLAGLDPGLLRPDVAQVFVIETAAGERDAALRRCEIATAGRALVARDPRHERRVVIIAPVTPGDEHGSSVTGELSRVVARLGAPASLGGSGHYSLALVAEAFNDALVAQRFAVQRPDSIALCTQDADFVSLLPERDAQRWARCLLRPLMEAESVWQQVRRTLPVALSYPYTVAARRLDLHRNTVTRHVSNAAAFLGMELGTAAHRTAVGLALELVNQRDGIMSDDPDSGPVPTLRALLAAPQLSSWADALLRPARSDRRSLLNTASQWLKHDAHIEPTARALNISEVTVRSHLRALEHHMSRDLHSLAGLRDLAFSLHIFTGFSIFADVESRLTAAA